MSDSIPPITIGTKFTTRGKCPRECTVFDIYKTYNNAGDLVKTRFCASHLFVNQIVNDYDVPESTIRRGLIK